jgi:hypothetical protein
MELAKERAAHQENAQICNDDGWLIRTPRRAYSPTDSHSAVESTAKRRRVLTSEKILVFYK